MSWQGQVPCHPIDGLCVYVEVPKAGCTSVKWALSPLKGGPPEDGEDIHGWTGYTTAADADQCRLWLGTRWAEIFRFTVLRDPVDRFVSFYWGLAPHERGCWGDIDRYVTSGAFERDAWAWDIHAIPQALLVGSSIDLFDYVGRTDWMGELETALRERVHSSIRIPHLNRSPRPEDPLTPETVKVLRELYASDYDLLEVACG